MSRGADGVATQAGTAMAQLSTYARPRFADDAAVAYAHLTRDADATSAALAALPNPVRTANVAGFSEPCRAPSNAVGLTR